VGVFIGKEFIGYGKPEIGARRESIRPITSTKEISHDKGNLKFFLA